MWVIFLAFMLKDTSYVKRELLKSDSLYLESYKDEALFDKAEKIVDSLLLNSKILVDEILWRKAHFCFERGYALKEISRKKEWYKKGEEFARLAIKNNPNNPEAHFWFAINKGAIGKLNGVLHSLFMIGDLKKEAERIIELKPDHPGAHIIIGEIYKSLPEIFGGDKNKALDEFKLAIEKDSLYTASYISLAETYKEIGDSSKAKETLYKLLSLKNSRDIRRFNLYEIKEAKELLRQIK
ncbi:MAG: hypothetical protein ABIN61_03895 [candidate division WOR-3 bacterium]